MKRALASGFTAVVFLSVPAFSADVPSKTAPESRGARSLGNPGWNFKIAPNAGPVFADPSIPTDSATSAPPFAIQWNTKVVRKRTGEPTFTNLPRVWWTGDYLTPLEKSRRMIPRSDRVRE